MLIEILSVMFLLYSTTNANSDFETLLLLKSSLLDSRNSSALHDWFRPIHENPRSDTDYHCTFSGVTCDGGARVISLEITNTPLFGTIPPELGLLDNLVNLTLTETNLTGQLPLEMNKLRSLRHINLSTNSFHGVFRGEIFSTMDNLEVLSVDDNNFTGTLPVEFVKLKKLKKLILGGNYFYGEIPEVYSEFKCLESLALQINELTGKIPTSLAKLQTLQELHLGYSNAYDGGIPKELGLLSSLWLLNLGSCNLSGEIPASLGNLKNLHYLFFQMNHLSGEIPGELSSLVSLNSLDISMNELSGEVPGSFKELKNLTVINLFRNKLEGTIPDFIGELEFLEVLQIWENNFTLHLPENLGRNGSIYLLDVSNNRLTGRIPKDLCKSGRLETIVLVENEFSGFIPEELGECRSLKTVRLEKNVLDGQIPKGLFNLPSLRILELNDNNLTGELPTEISGSSLQILKLSNNWISREIPVEISILSNLWNVDFSANNLTGRIPSSIASCEKLIYIDLSRNKLQGEIPIELSRLDMLISLNLSRNQLSGEIRGEIGMLSGLVVLDLSYNDLVGRRPTTGTLEFIADRFFYGNPNLCPPHTHSCSSAIKHERQSSFKIIIIVLMVVIISLLMFITWGVWRRKLEKSLDWKLTALQKLDFGVDDVLDCLKEENIIGRGRAGIVYRGSMPNGVDVAIKKMVGRGSTRNGHGFSAEIKTLGRIRHRYIVRLLGYVSSEDTDLMLYDYMSHGSLGELLHGSEGGHLLWETRYKIAIEAAKGLSYLHHDCSPSIIHRDVKSNNILLDSDYEAHVADFGLAKFFQDVGASERMSAVVGSYGYIAPEYAYTLKVDQKSDVYSFGVVLLELITGRKPVGEFADGVDIVRWVRHTELSQPSDAALVVAVVDSRLAGYPLTAVINLFKIAMLCVEGNSASRPSMREVVHMLRKPPPDSSQPKCSLKCA